jgi:UDP-N-acetylmuramate--L-alanine ligase/UDP-N-acetylenolpyruvoylglucosamine reductase
MQTQHVHLIGIGGAGLSAIATVLLEQGYTVSGSDLRASPATERLAGRGAVVFIGHAAEHLGGAEVVLVSSAVPEGNPEVAEARRRGIPVLKRAEWLGHMMAGKRGVAIAGTHGKTTTTAMIAMLLRDAGLDPTFIVGGDISQSGLNAAAGGGDAFVVEADEYDRTFLGLQPEIAVLTTVEWDHPDCYPTPDSMLAAFREFLDRVPPRGLVVACGDDPGVRSLLEDRPIHPSRGNAGRLDSGPAFQRYGLGEDNDWRAINLESNARGGYDFDVWRSDDAASIGRVSLAVPGIHNAKNALAALVVADRLGVSFGQAAASLARFAGVGRRFEIKGEVQGILVVDDYAHHPTEIRATLAAARARYPARAIWAVFQPHTYSRTRALLDDFAGAFADVDHVVLVDIFAAREADDGSISSRDILDHMRHPDATYVGDLAAAAGWLAGRLRPGDVLITLGAGDGYRVGEMLIRQIGRTPARRRDPGAGEIAALARALEARFGRWLRRDEPMADHTTLRVGGLADLWLTVSSLGALIEAVSLAWQHQAPLLILGSGANMLVSDRGVRGLVLHNRCQQIAFAGDPAADPPHVLLEAGVILPSLAHRLAHQGLSGLEWAVGVPGTIGGAVVNNAGAYGSSMADCLVRAELLAGGSGERAWHPVNWFEYGYRSSKLKRPGSEPAEPYQAGASQYVVLQAELVLTRKTPSEIQNQMAAYTARRRATQPPGASLGSMFKNPPGDYAGRLIEAAGLKGVQIGGAQVSPVHANFFLNQGSASAADFAALIRLARETVNAKFGIELELEIQKIGDWEND